MANVRALRSGIWHDANPTTSPWGSGGQVFFPPASANVWLNNFTVHLTANATVLSISNASKASGPWVYGDNVAASAGGTVNLFNNTIFTALSVINGGAQSGTISLSGTSSAQIVGNGIPTTGGTGTHTLILNNSTGTLTFVGNIEGGSSDCRGIINNALGYVVVTGNVAGKSGFCDAIRNSVAGTIIVTGNVEGGSGGSSFGIQNITTASGATNIITGNIKGGSNSSAPGIILNGNTIVNVVGSVEATNTISGINGSVSTAVGSVIRISGNILNSANGTAAIYAPSYRIDPIPQNGYIRYARNGTGVGSDAWLFQYTTDSLSAFSMPPVSSVRFGTTFANATLTGTCAIPSPSSVTFGVPTDNTTGIALLAANTLFDVPIASLTATNSLGERLKNSATVESVGRIISSFSN